MVWDSAFRAITSMQPQWSSNWTAWKWALKGQLCRVPWPWSTWMPFSCQPALRVLQQPHRYSHSSKLLTLNKHITTFSMLYQLFLLIYYFFFNPRGFLQSTPGHIQAPPGHLKGPQATSKWHAPLVDSGCCHREKVNRSMNLINSMRLTSSPYLFMRKMMPFRGYTGSSTLTLLTLHTWVMTALNPGLIMLPSPLLLLVWSHFTQFKMAEIYPTIILFLWNYSGVSTSASTLFHGCLVKGHPWKLLQVSNAVSCSLTTLESKLSDDTVSCSNPKCVVHQMQLKK